MILSKTVVLMSIAAPLLVSPFAPSPTPLESISYTTQRAATGDRFSDWRHPSTRNNTFYQQILNDLVKPLEILTSPVYFSTDQCTGSVIRGLSAIPSPEKISGPLLIVGNHQLFGFDMWMMVPHLYEDRKIALRGLAHDIVFQSEKKGNNGLMEQIDQKNITMHSAVEYVYGLFREFGAVPATPYSFYRLAQSKQSILHYPGGAREAYHEKGDEYSLFWPGCDNNDESPPHDFVRVAARFNATIVPLSAIGAADSGLFLGSGSSDDFTNAINTFRCIFPQLSSSIQNLHDSPLTAKGGREKNNPRPPPLVFPKLTPSRHYFLFGPPYQTDQLDHNDRKECSLVYQEIESRVQHGIENLLLLSKKDPNRDFLKRFLYETLTAKKAPTFCVNEF
mmetsp:Transcript_30140/g.61519  ORF Transcript_30140/g.61519 Transcript_30140/m.61519 type:complete len:392 (-) Transcript_30140:156-1331(-)